MPLRLVLGVVRLALAGTALADPVSNTPVPYTGLAVGLALALTVVYDTLWLRRRHRSEASRPAHRS